MLLGIVAFLIILSVLVLIHEAGHFTVAKIFGIKVEEFGFGLPLTRAIFSVKRGETVYSLYPALIGGFVKLYGEDEAGSGTVSLKPHQLEKKDLDRAFFSKSPLQRALVIVAGVVMNVFLAAAIFYVFLFMSNFTTDLPQLNNHTFFFVTQTNIPSEVIVEQVASGSPAEKAGITVPSRVLKLDGRAIVPDNFVNEVDKYKGKQITLTLENQNTNKIYSVSLTPRVSPPQGQGAMGVAIGTTYAIAHLVYKTPLEKLFSGFVHPANLLVWNFESIAYLIEQSFKQNNFAPVANSVAGPVGIYSLVSAVVSIPNTKEAIMGLLNLSGLLSALLAFMNVLPIPGLDGGRLLFIVIEGITGKKVNPVIEGYANTIGIAFLLLLMAVITLHDIIRLVSGQPLIPQIK
ncbi:site-2 protease family protein [Patescibacteria group bacterium]|nr:site-2 protease family protein [Patescibacteria group bacterium]